MGHGSGALPRIQTGHPELQMRQVIHRKAIGLGLNDINSTNTAINRINHVTEVTLTASGWEGGAAPYTQTVSVPGATADLDAILVSALADGASVTTQKAYIKAFGIISSGTASLGNGTATFKVYKKPATDCLVGLKGV